MERLEYGYQLFSAAYFSRGTLSQKMQKGTTGGTLGGCWRGGRMLGVLEPRDGSIFGAQKLDGWILGSGSWGTKFGETKRNQPFWGPIGKPWVRETQQAVLEPKETPVVVAFGFRERQR